MKFTRPIKLVMGGNEAACHHYIRYAAKQLGILENQMSFQGLNSGRRVVSPIDGVLVECISRFGYKETRIYVRPEVTAKAGGVQRQRRERQLEREYQKCKPYYFYVRIGCPKAATGPTTDRIILYEMDFTGLPADTPLTDTANADNNFTPGGGRVVADVDLLEEVLIYPENLSASEERLLINMAVSLSKMDGPRNHADTWYAKGPLANITDAVEVAGYPISSIPDEPLGIYLSDKVDISDTVSWWFITDPPELDSFGTYSEWRNKWSPLEGGKTTWYTNKDWLEYSGDPANFIGDGYPWEDFQEIAEAYYGRYTLVNNERPDDYRAYTIYETFEFVDDGDLNTYAVHGYKHALAPNEDMNSEVISGNFFTAPLPDGAPSFFIASVGHKGNREVYLTVNKKSGAPSYDFSIGLWSIPRLDFTITSPTVLELVTPLEKIDVSDFTTIILGSEAEDEPHTNCSELVDSYWEKFAGFELRNRVGFISYGDEIDDVARDKIAQHFGQSRESLSIPNGVVLNGATPGDSYAVKNAEGDSERWEEISCSIINEPEQDDPSCQTKLSSLFYFGEAITTGQSFVAEYPSPGAIINRHCDGIYEGDPGIEPEAWKKNTYQRDIGCVVYIFAPREIYGTDSAGNTTYWDIHSARVDSNHINPFRCLDFEEYLLDVFTNISKSLDADPTLAKLRYVDPPVAHILEYYGYDIKTGFVRRG